MYVLCVIVANVTKLNQITDRKIAAAVHSRVQLGEMHFNVGIQLNPSELASVGIVKNTPFAHARGAPFATLVQS